MSADSDPQRNSKSHWVTIQWAFLIALGIVAVAYFAMPVRAASQPAWAAELWTTERGEELVAVVYSRPPEANEIVPAITILCGDPLWLRYDPGPQGDEVDWTGQHATFEFGFGDKQIERELVYEAMDGNWAIQLASSDEILSAIEAGSEVTILMPGGGLDAQTFSLRGSRAAIQEVRDSCS
jgi:hypothetical protein